MRVVRYELRSAAELDTLARAPLPLGIHAAQPRAASHRDLYLDTPDDALRERGIVCRLRIGATVAAPAHSGARQRRAAGACRGDGARGDRRARARGRHGRAPAPAEHGRSVGAGAARRARGRPAHARREPRPAPPSARSRCTSTASRSAATASRARSSSSARTIGAASISEFERLVEALEREHDLVGAEGDRASARRAACCAGCGRPRREWHARELRRTNRRSSRTAGATPEMLSPELSLLAFQRRVLAIAEDPSTPLRERLRFLGIVTSNLDEFFMVRMPELRQAAASRPDGGHSRGLDGLTAGDRLDRVEQRDRLDRRGAVALRRRVPAQRPRRSACASCAGAIWRPSSSARPARALPRRDLSRAHAARDDAEPGTSAAAPARTSGSRSPSCSAAARRSEAHLAELELPRDVAAPAAGARPRRATVIPVEEVLRANVDLLYPERARRRSPSLPRHARRRSRARRAQRGRSARGRRPTRRSGGRTTPPCASRSSATMPHVRRRAGAREPASRGSRVAPTARSSARCEVVTGCSTCAAWPISRCPTIRRSATRRSRSARASTPTRLDDRRRRARATSSSIIRSTTSSRPSSASCARRRPIRTSRRSRSRCTASGDPSAVVDALLAAARAGKKVVGARRAQGAVRRGAQRRLGARARDGRRATSSTGFVGLKMHAKVALVVRREGATLRRYAHVGTGNYNTRSGRQYTDLSLFSAREALTCRRRRPVQRAHRIVAPAGGALARRARRAACSCCPPCSS